MVPNNHITTSKSKTSGITSFVIHIRSYILSRSREYSPELDELMWFRITNSKLFYFPYHTIWSILMKSILIHCLDLNLPRWETSCNPLGTKFLFSRFVLIQCAASERMSMPFSSPPPYLLEGSWISETHSGLFSFHWSSGIWWVQGWSSLECPTKKEQWLGEAKKK